jgi:DHA2 family multidrug resistance protein
MTTISVTQRTPAAISRPYDKKWLIAIGSSLAGVMELIQTTSVSVALHQIGGSLNATLDEITWVPVGFILSAAIVLPMTGWLSSFFGRKRYFLGSILIFIAGSVAAANAGSVGMLIACMVFQGLGGGALIATAQAILFDAFPPEQKTTAAAVFGIGMLVGPAIGPTLGGIIVNRYSWEWVYLINVPFGIVSFLMSWAFVPDTPPDRKPGRVDLLGFLLLAVGIGSLQYVLERGEHHQWFDSGLIQVLGLVAAVGLVAMVWWELRVRDPVLDLRLLKDRSLAAGSLFVAALGIGMYTSTYALPIFLQSAIHMDAETVGWLMLPGAIAAALGMVAIVRLGAHTDLRLFIAVGAVAMAVGMWMHGQFTGEIGQHDVFWPVVLRGIGTGLMFVPLTTLAMSHLTGRSLSHGAAIYNLARQLGGSIGLAGMATLLTRYTNIFRGALVEHVTIYDAATQQRLSMIKPALEAKGFDPVSAQTAALQVLDRTVQAQASVLAFERVFILIGLVFVFGLPLLLLLRGAKGESAGMGAH